MRLAVLADTHGNLPALEAVLADVRQQGVDGIIVAGDFTTGGPHQLETFNLLRSLDSWMIRGNSEGYLLAYDVGNVSDGWRASKQWASVRWSHLRLNREILDFIAALPEQRIVTLDDAAPIRVVHGSPRSPSEHLFPDRDPVALDAFRRAGLLLPGRDPAKLDRALAQVKEPVLVCGHSHIPWKQEQDGLLALNPGSVGAPINGDVRAQYALLTCQRSWPSKTVSWQAEHRAIAYDLERIRAAFHESGLLEEGGAFSRAWLLHIETGQNVSGRFVSYACRLAAEAGYEGGGVVSDSVWEQAIATFDWEGVAQQGDVV